MMAVSSIVVKYVYVKIYLLFSIRRLYEAFKPIFTHAGLTRKRKIVLLRFGFIGEERKKCFLYHLVKEKNILSAKVPSAPPL